MLFIRDFGEQCVMNCYQLLKKIYLFIHYVFQLWTSLGLNQGPPDYESVALTN